MCASAVGDLAVGPGSPRPGPRWHGPTLWSGTGTGPQDLGPVSVSASLAGVHPALSQPGEGRASGGCSGRLLSTRRAPGLPPRPSLSAVGAGTGSLATRFLGDKTRRPRATAADRGSEKSGRERRGCPLSRARSPEAPPGRSRGRAAGLADGLALASSWWLGRRRGGSRGLWWDGRGRSVKTFRASPGWLVWFSGWRVGL